MEFLSKTNSSENSISNLDLEAQNKKKTSSRELKIITTKAVKDKSPMSQNLKDKLNSDAPNLSTLFEKVAKRQGEENNYELYSDGSIYADGISPRTLHTFTLEAAKYGKTITYKEVKTIVVSD